MDIYFNYCPDSHTSETATLVKCTRDSFESGFIKAVELNVSEVGSTLGVYDSAQDVFNDLMSDIEYYWDNDLNDEEFIEAVNNILDENPDLFDVCDFIASDKPGDITDDMVVIGGDTL